MSGRSRLSSSRNVTYRPRAAASPALRAPDTPSGRSLRTTRTRGSASSPTGVTEPSSATTTSMSRSVWPSALATASRSCSGRSRVGMTIESLSSGNAPRAHGARGPAPPADRAARGRARPFASNSFAYTLVSVNPGIVFSSFTSTRRLALGVLDEEVTPRHARAAHLQEHLHGERAHALAHLLGQPGGHHQVHPARLVLRLVVVPLGIDHDLARQRRLGLEVAQHRALDLHAVRPSPPRSPAGRARRPPPARPPARPREDTFEMPTDDPSRAGFTNTGSPSRSSLRRIARPRGWRQVVDLRHPVGGHQVLEQHLVHAHGRGHHAGAGVGHVERLQQRPGRFRPRRRGRAGPGKATSQPSSPPARLERHRPARRATSGRRARSPPPPARGRACSRPARTAAADASDTSCSHERPPARTATLTAMLPAVTPRVGVGLGLLEAPDDHDHRAALVHLHARRPGAGRAPGRPPPRCRWRAGARVIAELVAAQHPARVLLASGPTRFGTSTCSRPSETVIVTRVALVELRAGRRALGDHLVLGLVGRRAAPRRTSRPSRVRRVSAASRVRPTTSGIGRLLGPRAHEQPHARPALHPRRPPWARCRSRSPSSPCRRPAGPP